MELSKINSIYFLGIGGIGMSSLARYFHAQNMKVGGYDRTSTPLTSKLVSLGMKVHFSENVHLVQNEFPDKNTTLVIRTPAVPEDHAELLYFKANNYTVVKRAEVLGYLLNQKKGIAIAGTHGKTSVTTFTTYFLREGGIDCSAFLGGISKNYDTNLVMGSSEYVVAEADEFDRSFLHLNPYLSLVTTVDADHLDIYSNLEDIRETFKEFIHKTYSNGVIILNSQVNITVDGSQQKYTYSLMDKSSDFFASDINIKNGYYEFTFNTPQGACEGFRLNVPGKTNIENSIAAMGIAWILGVPIERLRDSIPGLKGVVRRFDIQYQDENRIYFDDYAHHPREIDAVVGSLRDLFPGRKLTGIFQPHLFSRTRDFADDFAKSLSKFDELILLDIYPAREKPLPGVTSKMLLDKITVEKKQSCSKENLLRILKGLNIEVLLTIGAGDIDQYVSSIKDFLKKGEEA